MKPNEEKKFWEGKRVFITGATGIVGSWLVKELLARRAEVVALVRDSNPQSELFRSGDIYRINVVTGRLEDFSALERALNEYEADTVFHLAAQPLVGMALRYPLHTFESNIRGSYHLLEACRLHSRFVKRVIVASSDKAYGEQDHLPYTEDMPLKGRYPYEVSKSCTDLIAQSYAVTYGLPVAIARCGNIFGGGDLNWSRIIPGTIRSLINGERPVVRSNGKFIRDYIYVKDVVLGYLCLAEQLENPRVQGEGFNFGPEKPLDVLELIRLIRSRMYNAGVDCRSLEPVILDQVSHEIFAQYLSSQKAIDVLGWNSRYSIEDGMDETIEWYRDYFSREP